MIGAPANHRPPASGYEVSPVRLPLALVSSLIYIFSSIPPIPIDGPSGSRETYHDLDALNLLDVHLISPCNRRTSCMQCQQLLLTAWAGRVAIDMLPDDVLLPIFHFDRVNGLNDDDRMNLPVSWRWHRLVHVCRRWRSVGFASPNSLQLRLVCHRTGNACVRQLGIWPPLPIIIRNITGSSNEHMWEDYVIDVATAHHNRICAIHLAYLSRSQVRRLASTMRQQFPALIHLSLSLESYHGRALGPPLPDGFLGGFAPRLQTFKLGNIPFPALPKLLLSATDLVFLELWNVPYSGYTLLFDS